MRQTNQPKTPATVYLLWCPECGRDDRFNALRQTMPHNSPSGRRCPGKVIRVEYEPKRQDGLR